jgi:hypothetical protein
MQSYEYDYDEKIHSAPVSIFFKVKRFRPMRIGRKGGRRMALKPLKHLAGYNQILYLQ